MKIVCKHKDFYDFFTHDYDADIVYVREPVAVHTSYKNLYDDNSGKFYTDKSRYISASGYSRKYKNEGHIWFDNYIFGIYPYVYSQPVIGVCVNTITGYDEIITQTVSKKEYTELCSLKTSDEQEAWLLLYAKKMVMDYSVNHYIKFPKNYHISKTPHRLYSDYFGKFVWKYECREIFQKLNAPVWIEANDDLINNSIYFEYANEPKMKHIGELRYPVYITNVCFNKLNINILKFWYNDLMDLNTYINIENFLWSVKQEPISTPDNNTKIVSHGFDLKTSFRKM